jgi:lantibiotic modifying enzyme
MLDIARHAPLGEVAWDDSEVQAAIDEIVADALTHFDEVRFWPAHPQDEGAEDGDTSLYMGAAGMIWALGYLRRTGATNQTRHFVAVLDALVEAARQQAARIVDYGRHGSLHFGDLAAMLVAMRLRPQAATADAIHARARDNDDLPVRELMWGVAGSMLACLFMEEMTGEARWRSLFATQAVRLLNDLVETDLGPLWTQDLFGSKKRYLGPVHGFAGNMVPLIRGWSWLDARQRARVANAVPRTLAANAVTSELGAQWPPVAGMAEAPCLCQHCHGAPGMVTTFADAPFSTPEMEALLIAGGELTWHAGPLTKGSNLCHGTAGNGYAFLKLYRRTGDAKWLERARAFAARSIVQCQEARATHGRGRYLCVPKTLFELMT